MSGAAEIGSVQILCYAQRGERSVQTGGSECSNIRPPITPSYGGSPGMAILLLCMYIFLYVYIWARKWVDFIFDLFLHIFFLDYLLFPTLAKDLSQKYHIKCLLFLVIRKKWIIEESFGMHLNKELWNYYFYILNINFKHGREA